MIRVGVRMIRLYPDDPGVHPDDPGRSSAWLCSREEHKNWGEKKKIGSFWVDFMVGKVGMDGGRLDPLAKQQIYGPKNKISQDLTNCKKNFWGYFCGDF